MGDFRFIFVAADYDTTIAFYRDTLELAVHDSWDDHGRGTIFDCADGQIEVFEAAGPEDLPPTGVRIAYEVADATVWHDKLAAKNVPITQELGIQPWGHRNFGITDPDGIPVILFEVLPG